MAGATGANGPAARTKRAEVADERIRRDPWDVEAWQMLCADAQARGLEEARADYERCVAQFPTAGAFWKLWAEHTLRERVTRRVVAREAPATVADGKGEVEDVYKRGLVWCRTSVELWRSYSDFARSSLTRERATDIYEKALDAVGLDVASHSIWSDYLAFVRSAPVEDHVKRQSLRRLYERVIRMPINNIDSFWREYEAFENAGANKDLARGKILENNPKYVAARAEVRGRKNRREGILFSALACPPRNVPREDEQAHRWKRYLSLERSNPHALDRPDLYARVSYAFDNALAYLYRYPDVWVEAARFHMEETKVDVAAEILRRAVEAVPRCPLVYFEMAALQELRKEKPAARKIYEQLLEVAPSSIAYIQFMKFVRRCEGVDASRKIFTRARKDTQHVTYHVYAAAGLMEYQLNREPKVARNIFELGLKTFPQSVDFALEYISFLWNQGEDSYIRVIFERVLTSLPESQETLKLWNKYVEYENTFGDAESFAQTEKRSREAASAFYAQTWIDPAVARYSFLDLLPLSPAELDASQAHAIETKKTSDTGPGGHGRTQRVGRRVSDDHKAPGGSGGGDEPPLSIEEAISRLVIMASPMNDSRPELSFVVNLIMSTPAALDATPAGGSTKRRRQADGDSGPGGTGVSDIFKTRQAQRAKRS